MRWALNEGEPGDYESRVDAELSDNLEDEQWSLLKGKLAPGEDVLWTERAGLPQAPTMAVFPAFFTAVLCGLSGYALMVVFGIYGLREVGPVVARLDWSATSRSRSGDLHRTAGPLGRFPSNPRPALAYVVCLDQLPSLGREAPES